MYGYQTGTDAIRKNAKDSDLFICEGMYGEKDKQKQRQEEYKHMTFYEAAKLAKDAAGKRNVADALQPVTESDRKNIWKM